MTAYPARPWPPAFALAYRYADVTRTMRLNSARPRCQAYREALGARSAIRSVIGDTFAGVAGVLADVDRDLLQRPAAGPDWLIETAMAITERLDGVAGAYARALAAEVDR